MCCLSPLTLTEIYSWDKQTSLCNFLSEICLVTFPVYFARSITAGLLWLVSTVKRAPRNGWAGPKSSSDVQLSYNHCLNVYFKIHIPNKKERRRRKHREENLCGFFLSKSNEAVERQRSWAGRCSLSEKHSTENPPSFLRCWNKHLLTHLDLLSLE